MTAAFARLDQINALPEADHVGVGQKLDGSNVRVALFSGNYNYVRDGANQALNRLVAFLERHGATVRVYSPTVKEPAFEPQGTLISVPSVPVPFRREYRIALGLPKRIERDLDAFAPNVVHISAPDFLGQKAVAYARSRGVPVAASVHTRFENYLRDYKLGWLENYLTRKISGTYNSCDEIYVPTPCMADIMADAGVTVPIKMWTRGVETSLFRPDRRDLGWRQSLGIADTDVVISFVGRLVYEKGLGTYAETIRTLKERGLNFKVMVVGEGPAKQWFQDRMPEALFLGFMNGEDLARAYASSDIFLNPSSTEAFGNVTLEAMASGVPPVCADSTGSRYLVHNGENGYLVPPEDVKSYADRLESLISDRELRRRFATASIARGLSFKWDAILGEVLGHYQALLAKAETRTT